MYTYVYPVASSAVTPKRRSQPGASAASSQVATHDIL